MIKVKNKVINKIYKNPPIPFIFNPEKYNIKKGLTGKGIKISIIDSGCPEHDDIKGIVEKTSFCNGSELEDIFGHSSIISGIITGYHSKKIIGVAHESKLYFAKAIGNKGEGSFNALVASILWSIVKEVDVILLALGSQIHYPLFYDAIKKAYHSNICIVAAAGNETKNKGIDYPARYSEVLSVASLTKNDKYNEIIKKESDIIIDNMNVYTLYPDNNYIRASGSSISAAFIAGITSLFLEEYKIRSKSFFVHEIYDKIKKVKF